MNNNVVILDKTDLEVFQTALVAIDNVIDSFRCCEGEVPLSEIRTMVTALKAVLEFVPLTWTIPPPPRI